MLGLGRLYVLRGTYDVGGGVEARVRRVMWWKFVRCQDWGWRF